MTNAEPAHNHQYIKWATFHYAPTGPEPEHPVEVTHHPKDITELNVVKVQIKVKQ